MKLIAKRLGLTLLGVLVACVGSTCIAQTFEFFAFDNGVGRGNLTAEQQAEILGDLKFSGIGYTGTQNIPAMLAALDARGLKFYSTYVPVNLQDNESAYDASLPAAIRQLKGRNAVLWIHVHGGPPSAADLDDRAVEVLRELSALAETSGVRIALYPHTGFYVATVADAVRLAKKVNRPNVGASFNLCHFLKLDSEQNIRQALEEAKPYLFLVSVNGADAGDTQAMGWDRLIQPLGKGSFNIRGFLKTLKEIGYTGPVGLQCYGIRAKPREHLSESMKAWAKICEEL
jgi:sugar phosphate isomerase/epimerase